MSNQVRKTRLSIEAIMEAAEAGDGRGFCLSCGAEANGVEPDARQYECESCGQSKVYGAEELILMGVGI